MAEQGPREGMVKRSREACNHLCTLKYINIRTHNLVWLMLQTLLNLRRQDEITHVQESCIGRFPLDSAILVPEEKQITNILSYSYGTDNWFLWNKRSTEQGGGCYPFKSNSRIDWEMAGFLKGKHWLELSLNVVHIHTSEKKELSQREIWGYEASLAISKHLSQVSGGRTNLLYNLGV